MYRCRTIALIVSCVIGARASHAADAITLPGGGKLEKVDFERHVMGLLSKAGCNTGGCHGSFQGKNGFRLSLFGYEPSLDFTALTRDNLGRRVNPARPDESLMLLKGAGRMTHEGGVRFGQESWQYGVLRKWIADGATWAKDSGKITDLSLTPGDFLVLKGGDSGRVTVTATFEDGSREDVTPFCDFKVADDTVAAVTAYGEVTAARPGDTGLTVLYRGAVRAVRVLVPSPAAPGFTYPRTPEANYVDREVFAKLAKLNMVPSDLSADDEFLRRVTIDTIGLLPTPEEVRAFLNDTSPDKRRAKIDALLKHPLHAALWATKMSDVTGNNTDMLENPPALRFKRSQLWHDWLRKRFADNTPYDKTVRDIMTATSLDGKTPEQWLEFVKTIDGELEKGVKTSYGEKPTLDLFWRRLGNVPVEQWGEKVAAAFMGVRLECCQCHKHPTDRWTQDEYWAFANVFSGVTFGAVNVNNPKLNGQYSSPAVKAVVEPENVKRREAVGDAQGAQNRVNLIRELYVAERLRPRPATGTTKVTPPGLLGGPALSPKPGEDIRKNLAEWLTDPKNPFFARSFVNRVWAHYFGVGLVNPVDDFSQANPPTNPALLDALAADFVKSGYDIRRLERTILASRTYQLSSRTNATNRFDKNNFSHGYVRPLMAEQVVDVLNSALGVEEAFTGFPAGTKMSEIGATLLGGNTGINNGNLTYILKIFGRPLRSTACDCERATEPALPQTLFRMSDPTLKQKIEANAGRAVRIAKAKMSDEKTVEELFLATLSRMPTETEKEKAKRHLTVEKDRTNAIQDLMWALINTREFILNH
jgi:hypothetical protein